MESDEEKDREKRQGGEVESETLRAGEMMRQREMARRLLSK
jgi:hypothetical protein